MVFTTHENGDLGLVYCCFHIDRDIVGYFNRDYVVISKIMGVSFMLMCRIVYLTFYSYHCHYVVASLRTIPKHKYTYGPIFTTS